MAKVKTSNEYDYRKLIVDLRRGEAKSLYLLAGEETYLIRSLLKELQKTFISPGAEDLDVFKYDSQSSENKLSPKVLIEQIKTPAFISARRLFILRRTGWFNGSVPFAEQLIDMFKSLDDTVCLVFWEEKVDNRQKKLLDAVRKYGIYGVLNRQTVQELTRWLSGFFAKYKLNISRAAAEKLISVAQSDMFTLMNEVNKITLYCQATAQTEVSEALLDLVSPPDLAGNIFQLNDTLLSGRSDRAINLLHKLLVQPQPPLLILFMLARHIKQLIIVKSITNREEAAAALHIPGFALDKLYRQSSAYSLEKLVKIYNNCYLSDRAIKNGDLDEVLALELLITSFIPKWV